MLLTQSYKTLRQLVYLLLLVSMGTGCSHPNRQAGICLSFDDRTITQWYQMRGLLNQYHAHVTFFVSQFDSLSEAEIQMLYQLEKDGHEIASHGAMHIQAEQYIKEHTYKEYLANEVDRSIESMKKSGFNPVSFAYPYGSKYWFTDYLLLKQFKITRGVAAATGRDSLNKVNEIFYDFDNNRKLESMVIDGQFPLTQEGLAQCIKRVVNNKEVVLLSGHVPNHDEKPAPYSFSPSLLESILKEAQNHHLRFYRFCDL